MMREEDMTIRNFPTDEWVEQSHRARSSLGQMLKLIEDGILVRNTKDDGKMTDFVEQSIRLTTVLKAAQEALK
jgi:heme A synthase